MLLLLAKLRAGDSAASYAYDLTRGPEYPRLNIEQQAMVVEDAFRLSRGGAAPHPAAFYARASAHCDQSRPSAATSRSRSASLCSGDGVRRSRSVPLATVGKLIGCT